MLAKSARPPTMLLGALLLTSCVNLSSPTPAIPVGDTATAKSFCAAARPLRLSKPAVEAMSVDDLRQVKAHNCTGRSLCGWAIDPRGCDPKP